MLDRIIDALKKKSAPKPSAPVTPEVKRLAAAALLVEAARRDEDFAADERATITRTVGENLNLNSNDATTLLALAQQPHRQPYAKSTFPRTPPHTFQATS